jgi:hypothetical protein
MTHAAIYEKGIDRISHFIRDCVQTGRDFRGSNGSVTGVKERLFDILWTDDDGESGGSVKALRQAQRYQGRVVSTPEDIDRVTRELIAEKYPPHEETKLLRLKLSGDDTGWKEYQDHVDKCIQAGRALKYKMGVRNG